MEKALKFLNTFFLAGILLVLSLIYLKIPSIYTVGDYTNEIKLGEDHINSAYDKLPAFTIIGEVSAEITNDELRTVTEIDNSGPIQVEISNH